MSTKLYPGVAFSPRAALADNIGAADTVIQVTDVSAFPEAPNLATIGTDEEGETILYAAKTSNALSGCVRGVEGTARAWSAGEAIGRNWTAKDHADLIAAVSEVRTAAEGAQDAAETAQQSAGDAQASAGAAQKSAEEAQAQAGAAAQTSAEAVRAALEAQGAADTASTAAAAAQASAGTAQTTAEQAASDAGAAQKTAKEAKETAEAAATMDQVNGAIEAAITGAIEEVYYGTQGAETAV